MTHAPRDSLVLFDIDGTLVLTDGAGRDGMLAALASMTGAPATADGVRFAGGVDPEIYLALAARAGLEEPERHHDRFRETYRERLAERLRTRPTARALPGVHALLDAVSALAGVTVGLLTGNYRDTAELKLRAAGIDPARFAFGAFGDDGARRLDLPPVAMRRFFERTGREIDPASVILVGDTPSDIESANAAGCRCIGVATGPYGVDDLLGAGAWRAAADLRDTGTLVGWLRSSSP